MTRFAAVLAVGLMASSCSTVVHQPKQRRAAEFDAKQAGGGPPLPRKMQKWNPAWWIGNVDTPIPPPDYKPDDPRRERKYQWRNPGHNFTFYVIGIADKKFTRMGRHPEDVFRPGGGLNWAVSRYHLLLLPFVSYQGRHCSTYFGWRERGNFGAKLNLRWRGVEPR